MTLRALHLLQLGQCLAGLNSNQYPWEEHIMREWKSIYAPKSRWLPILNPPSDGQVAPRSTFSPTSKGNRRRSSDGTRRPSPRSEGEDDSGEEVVHHRNGLRENWRKHRGKSGRRNHYAGKHQNGVLLEYSAKSVGAVEDQPAPFLRLNRWKTVGQTVNTKPSVEVGAGVTAVDRISNWTFIKFALHFPRNMLSPPLLLLPSGGRTHGASPSTCVLQLLAAACTSSASMIMINICVSHRDPNDMACDDDWIEYDVDPRYMYLVRKLKSHINIGEPEGVLVFEEIQYIRPEWNLVVGRESFQNRRTAKVHVTDTDNTRLTTDVEAGRMRSLLFKFVPDADEYADAGGDLLMMPVQEGNARDVRTSTRLDFEGGLR
ncbi:hypothetical protein B0H13DRAFT_1922920 [Mycena leptocephala]|nr:hypothetical protein B0H13DRAFT_1922920 [Mycena leptocephala]